MSVPVMEVRPVRVVMSGLFVAVEVGMRSRRIFCVRMTVVEIVMRVLMRMLHFGVSVVVPVTLGQHDPDRSEQEGSRHHLYGGKAFAERENGQQHSEHRGYGEDKLAADRPQFLRG